jgi:tight adherence protein B
VTGAAAAVEPVATIVHRLAVLLDAGVAPGSAWRHAARGVGSAVGDAVLREIEAGGAVGAELTDAILVARGLASIEERATWSALACAWSVATESGAPLAPSLRRFAEVLRDLSQSRREVEVALAGPVATARIVLALPAIGILFGVLLGFDALRVLATTAPGWACAAVGGLLTAGGIRWNRRLIGRARTVDPTPGLGLELLAIAVSGGSSLDRARGMVDAQLDRADLAPLGDEADDVLDFARAAGVPVAALLRAESEERRRIARSDGQRRAGELGTRLLLPLGVCILPAFLALGVAPMLLAIISGTAAGLAGT